MFIQNDKAYYKHVNCEIGKNNVITNYFDRRLSINLNIDLLKLDFQDQFDIEFTWSVSQVIFSLENLHENFFLNLLKDNKIDQKIFDDFSNMPPLTFFDSDNYSSIFNNFITKVEIFLLKKELLELKTKNLKKSESLSKFLGITEEEKNQKNLIDKIKILENKIEEEIKNQKNLRDKILFLEKELKDKSEKEKIENYNSLIDRIKNLEDELKEERKNYKILSYIVYEKLEKESSEKIKTTKEGEK